MLTAVQWLALGNLGCSLCSVALAWCAARWVHCASQTLDRFKERIDRLEAIDDGDRWKH